MSTAFFCHSLANPKLQLQFLGSVSWTFARSTSSNVTYIYRPRLLDLIAWRAPSTDASYVISQDYNARRLDIALPNDEEPTKALPYLCSYLPTPSLPSRQKSFFSIQSLHHSGRRGEQTEMEGEEKPVYRCKECWHALLRRPDRNLSTAVSIN